MRIGGSILKECNSKEEWLATVQDLRYSTIIYSDNEAKVFDADLNTFKDFVESNNITVGEVGIWNNPLSMDKKKKSDAINECKNKLKIADELGANCCVNISGTKGEIWDGLYTENYYDSTYIELVDTIREIIDDVKPINSFYTIECMPWMIPDSPEAYIKLIKDVNRSEFGVHLDYVNMINSPRRYAFRDDFVESCFEILKSHIKSIHIKDIKMQKGFPIYLQECSPGEGDINIEKVIKLCDKLNPDIPVFVEHMNTYDEYKQAVRYLRETAGKCGVNVV